MGETERKGQRKESKGEATQGKGVKRDERKIKQDKTGCNTRDEEKEEDTKTGKAKGCTAR